jgi:hypothetical protein
MRRFNNRNTISYIFIYIDLIYEEYTSNKMKLYMKYKSYSLLFKILSIIYYIPILNFI